MELLTPDLGLIFWQLVVFGLLFFVLAKFAWKPIIASLHEREESIESALALAAKTREEMIELKAGNEKLLVEARAERDGILKAAKEASDKMIADAKAEAQKAASAEIEKARVAFEQEKASAVASIKKETVLFHWKLLRKFFVLNWQIALHKRNWLRIYYLMLN
jgi:F-type H+-transporting ATPase subunit b